MMTSVNTFFSFKTDAKVSTISNKQKKGKIFTSWMSLISRNQVRNAQIHGPKSVPKCQGSGTLQDRYVLRRTLILKGYKDYEFNYVDSLLLLTSSVRNQFAGIKIVMNLMISSFRILEVKWFGRISFTVFSCLLVCKGPILVILFNFNASIFLYNFNESNCLAKINGRIYL